MKQYECCLPGEYLGDISYELSTKMAIDIDYGIIEETAKNDGEPGEQCLAIFRKGESFVLMDLRSIDWLYAIVVRCEDDISEDVKAVMLKWDIEARKHYHQETRDDLEDRLGKEKSLLNDIVKVHGITI
ncbi:MAG: hypothetical protein ACM3UZ_10270 [Acidobacteriota bacterium]